MAPRAEQKEKVRTYASYMKRLLGANKSPLTIKAYRLHLIKYAKFLNALKVETKDKKGKIIESKLKYPKGVPVDDLHLHLNEDDVTDYAISIQKQKANTRKSCLFVIKNFMEYCGHTLDKFETDIFQVESDDERQDKPLKIETLQQMMDMADSHGKALISFLISTGCRAGEASKILLADVRGDTVTIRKEIAKKKKGGVVFLTLEALEYLQLWMKDRENYIKMADTKSGNIAHRINGRPQNDQRLFACSYMTLNKIFGKLYSQVDGEKSGNRDKVTCHSCRAYFRTRAVKTMGIDLVEGIMRHTGYLSKEYVHMPLEEKREIFHTGEAALYLTRVDHRIQGSKLDAQEKRIKELEGNIREMESKMQEKEQAINIADIGFSGMSKDPTFIDAVARKVLELQAKHK